MPELIKKELLEGHELDSILVANPDTDCDFEESVITPHNDPYVYNHRDYFQVLWGGQPHRIKPGETRIMPRFLAKHFAKHLADHLLMKKEEKENKSGLMQSPTERPKMLATILLSVEDFFLSPTQTSEGEKVEKMVEQLNPGERVQDLGAIPDPALGVLKPEPKPVDDILKEVAKATEDKPTSKTSIWDTDKPKPTKKELIEEASRLGIEITGKENVDTLINKIKLF